MKKVLIALMFAGLICPAVTFAGGIVTNANQSAAYIRMPAQDATIGIDALYYNPAGLAFLSDGFHLSINNQYILQTRKISSTFPMTRQDFEGGVVAPFFPSIYLAYKKDKVAFSFGFNPVGGGGSAKFEDGLPSFEKQIAILPPSLTGSGIPTSAYSFDTEFEGKSTMYGIQVNASYVITEKIAFSLGVRYVIAKNSYVGNMKNIMINPNKTGFGAAYDGTNMVSAPVFFTDASTVLRGLATSATGAAATLTSLALPPATPLTALPTATQTQLAQLLGAANISTTGMNVGTAIATLTAVAPGFTASANTMTGYAAATADKEVDAEQNGSGIAPIIGVDLKLSDKLNIGIRYEHKIKMKVKNDTKLDNIGLYPNGAKTSFDMPSTFSIGVSYKAMDKLAVSGGIHYYFDKNVDYAKKDLTGAYLDNKDVFDKNFLEIALGFEYSLSDKFLVSAGYLRTNTGANELYHSDLSHSLTTNTFGAGFKYVINEKMALNVGGMYSMYLEASRDYDAGAVPAIYPAYTETYNRNAIVGAVGLDIKF
ncbi:MAG: OmpP1/FadL family transporter [Tenuifilaceae bacterium]